MARSDLPRLLFSAPDGSVFDHPSLRLAGRSGDRMDRPPPSELIPLPEGSQLFTLPGRIPVGWDEKAGGFAPSGRAKAGRDEIDCTAVAAFLPPGYVRTLLPATRLRPGAPTLPLWAYSAVGWRDGTFWATGIQIDPDPHWHPQYFQDDRLLQKKVRTRLKAVPENRLLRQLSRCALEYHCFAAKNVFFRRWECPLPTSPTCNARCVGCISLQPSECCPASQERIDFVPTMEEVTGVALPHLKEAEDPIVSFGQGCEGEPLMQERLLSRAVRRLREGTDRGTINLNTNGSDPKKVERLSAAGLDSIRISLNSPHRDYYNRYYRPKGYGFDDVIDSFFAAKEKGLYVSVNLFVLPGFTDRESEVEGLMDLARRTRFDLLQMRNLNIDPDLYLSAMGPGSGMGISGMIERLRREFPSLQFGYFNRTRETFHGHA